MEEKTLEKPTFIVLEEKREKKEIKRAQGKIEYENMDDFRDYLDKEVKIYPWLEKKWSKFILDIILQSGKNKLKILDAACGLGLISENLVIEAKKVGIELEITGIDLSEEMISCAKKRAKERNLRNITFIPGNITNLPLPDNYFDLVIGVMVFFFLDEKELMQFLDETYRVLKTDGQFYFLHHNRNLLVSMGAIITTRKKKELKKIKFNYTPSELRFILNQHSLSKGIFNIRKRWRGLLVEASGNIKKGLESI